MILVLAGTTEGRELTAVLQQAGYRVSVAVVSSYGEDLLSLQAGSEVVAGRLDREGFTRWVTGQATSAVVDATHPFAEQISQLAMQVTAELGIPYIRLERPKEPLPQHPLIKSIERLEKMEEYFLSGQTVFSTLGTNHLEQLLDMSQRKAVRLVVRVLPRADVLKRCEELGLQPEQIIALKGPFSMELNRQLYLHYRADLILSKDSGQVGGLDSKIAAAMELEIPIVVWSRPVIEYPRWVNSASEVVDYLRELQGGFSNV